MTDQRPHYLPTLLRAVRLHRGLSQADLARLLDCRVPTVSGFESGASALSERTLEHVADALGISVRELLLEGLGLLQDQRGARAAEAIWRARRRGENAVERDTTPRPGPPATLSEDPAEDPDLVFGGPSGHPLPDRRGEEIEEPGSEECPPKPPHG